MPLTSINPPWDCYACLYLCFCLMLNYLLIWKENNWSVEFKYFASMLLCINFQFNFYDNFLRKTDSDVRYLLQTASCVGAQSMWCRHMMWLISASPNNPQHRTYDISSLFSIERAHNRPCFWQPTHFWSGWFWLWALKNFKTFSLLQTATHKIYVDLLTMICKAPKHG